MSVRKSSGRIDSLRARRKRARVRLSLLASVLGVVLVGTGIWLFWQPYLRVSKVVVYGADQASYEPFATHALAGTWLGIIPRDSILVVPAHAIRTAILAAHPEVAAVSVFRASLTSLAITVHERVAIARWCGLAPAADVSAYCYLFDGNGYIYAADQSTELGSSTPRALTLNSFDLYAPLVASSSDPLGRTLAHADQLPSVFSFARALDPLGSHVAQVVIRGDEVDDLLASGTRITYILGQEQQAFAALSASKSDLDLASGSIDYIDLRFPGEVYVKRKDATK